MRAKAKPFFCLFLTLALLAASAGCAGRSPAPDGGRLHVVASTYPIYALACAVAAGVDGVDLGRLNTGQVSCLHDYTLTAADARRLERADLLLINGAGLEEFLDSALERLDAPVADCSASVTLLEAEGHGHGHDGDGDDEGGGYDPHYWMDPRNAAGMARAIAGGLSQIDPGHAGLYERNAALASELLLESYGNWTGALGSLSRPYLITFHDGFRYFAQAFGLELLFAMEEEEGATASARDIRAAAGCVKEYGLPAVFMERNGSGSAARAVSGETGAAVRSLSMLMDGPAPPDSADPREILDELYLTPMGRNIETLAEVLQ